MSAARYVIEISVPSFGDNDGWRLHARMLQPDPLPAPEPRARPGGGTVTATDPRAEASAEACGPQVPAMEDVWRLQDAPLEAGRAGCSTAEYDRRVPGRQQAELAYLEGYDRALLQPEPLPGLAAEPEAGR